jgi:hypothetical protein
MAYEGAVRLAGPTVLLSSIIFKKFAKKLEIKTVDKSNALLSKY